MFVCALELGLASKERGWGVYTDKRPLTKNHQGRHDDAMAMPKHGSGFKISSTSQAVGNVLYLSYNQQISLRFVAKIG